MSAKSHGTSLSSDKILQPGSRFTRTKGGYDTGSRQYKCEAANAATLAPQIGDPDEDYPKMFVESVVITPGKADVAIIDVTYSGTLSSAAEPLSELKTEITYSLDANADFYSEMGSLGYKFTKYIPMVVHTYVSESFPAFNVGTTRNPPDYEDKIPAFTFAVDSDTISMTPSQQRWKIHNRNVQRSGDMYEVTDTYLYEYFIRTIAVIRSNGSVVSVTYDDPK